MTLLNLDMEKMMKTDHLTDEELIRHARGKGALVDALIERLEMRQGSAVIADVVQAQRLGALPTKGIDNLGSELMLPAMAEVAIRAKTPRGFAVLLELTTITALAIDPDFDKHWAEYVRSWYSNDAQLSLF